MVASMSTGVGLACGLFCEDSSVSTWESWLKKLLMEGRRVLGLGLSLMLCSTVRGFSLRMRASLGVVG